jgi:hypothetical protein
MVPRGSVPETMRGGLAPSREGWCRAAGCAPLRRSVTGLLLRPQKTRQGSDALPVWEPGAPHSRRARHEAVVAAGGAADALRPPHRAVIAGAPRGRGREVSSLAGTYAHPERGLKRWGGPKAWAPVEPRLAPSQTVVPAVRAKRARLEGSAVRGQPPHRQAEAWAYWHETVQESEAQRDAARGRVGELWPHRVQRLGSQTRTAMALDMVQPLAQDGHCPSAHSAVDHGVLRLERSRGIAHAGPHGGSALEGSRPIPWPGPWPRGDTGAPALRQAHPESFRAVRVHGRHGETKSFWVCTKVVRLQRYGRKRLVIVHDQEDRGDTPRFLLTEARHGDSGRVIETWSARWTAAIVHACGKQVCGLAAAQGRKEEAVKRHCRLRGVAPSLLQQAPASGADTDRCAFAQGAITIGQQVRTRARDALQSLLKLVAQLFAQGPSCEHILGILMPA